MMLLLFLSSLLALAKDPEGESTRVEKALRSTQSLIRSVHQISDNKRFRDPKKAFDHYLNMRLASFSESFRIEIQQFLKSNVKVKQISKKRLNPGEVTKGSYLNFLVANEKNSIEIELKDLKFKDSWVFYSTLAHELEHHLQHLILNQEPHRMKAYEKWTSGDTYSKKLVSQYQLIDYFTEIGAMIAEHHFLRLMSRSSLSDVKNKLKRLGISPLDVDWRSLDNIELDDSEFLRQEWTNRRYDLPNMFEKLSHVKFEDIVPSLTKVLSKEYCSRLMHASHK